MAIASDKITADVIEANEFPELSRRYRVSAVPTTVISRKGDPNGKIIIGSIPEGRFVEELAQLAGLTEDTRE